MKKENKERLIWIIIITLIIIFSIWMNVFVIKNPEQPAYVYANYTDGFQGKPLG